MNAISFVYLQPEIFGFGRQVVSGRTVKAFNFGPHGSFEPIVASSVASLD
jgi:hypothetical protein